MLFGSKHQPVYKTSHHLINNRVFGKFGKSDASSQTDAFICALQSVPHMSLYSLSLICTPFSTLFLLFLSLPLLYHPHFAAAVTESVLIPCLQSCLPPISPHLCFLFMLSLQLPVSDTCSGALYARVEPGCTNHTLAVKQSHGRWDPVSFPPLPSLSLSVSLSHWLLISPSTFIHFCVWARRANMDSLGIFILLMLLCFHWRAAPAGKVVINILISVIQVICSALISVLYCRLFG